MSASVADAAPTQTPRLTPRHQRHTQMQEIDVTRVVRGLTGGSPRSHQHETQRPLSMV